MIEKEKHEILVSEVGGKATIETYRFPDGSTINHLTPEELREVSEMLAEMADEMEEDA